MIFLFDFEVGLEGEPLLEVFVLVGFAPQLLLEYSYLLFVLLVELVDLTLQLLLVKRRLELGG